MADQPASRGISLRLVWPQWQGGGSPSVRQLAAEFPFEVAGRGYAVGAAVLEAVLPPHAGPTVTVPVTMSDDGLELRDGLEAKPILVQQLRRALEIIAQYDAARIVPSVVSAQSASPRSLPSLTATTTIWRWYGSTPIQTSARARVSTPATTPWRFRRLPDTRMQMCWRPFLPRSHRSGSPWPGSIPGPTTTTRTLPSGA
jgi:hypothetical protein